jgi:hypothetical protein
MREVLSLEDRVSFAAVQPAQRGGVPRKKKGAERKLCALALIKSRSEGLLHRCCLSR